MKTRSVPEPTRKFALSISISRKFLEANIGPLYYMSKLCVWNFTIYDMGAHKGRWNLWNETTGCRGSTEIASFLWKFFIMKIEEGVKKFILYSDNCGGQNRNKMVFSMIIKTALDYGVTVIHR